MRTYLLLAALVLVSPALAQDAATFAKRLADADAATREAAATGLAGLGPEALPALNELLKATQDRAFKVRVASIRALVAIGPKASEPSHKPLLGLLQDKSAQVREEAAKAMPPLGLASKSLPQLAGLFGDRKWRVRAAAIEAISSTGKAAEPLTEELLSLSTGDASPSVRKLAAAAFKKLEAGLSGSSGADPQATPSSQARWLGRDLGSILAAIENKDTRSRAFSELNAMGPLGASALPDLLSLLADADYSEAEWDLVYAIGDLGEGGAAAVPVLVARLKVDASRMGAAEALGSIGPSAKAAVPAMIQAWDAAPSASHRGALAGGFRGIGLASLPALERMKAAFPEDCQEDGNYLTALAHAIAGVGPEGGEYLLSKAADAKVPARARSAALVAAATCRGIEAKVAEAAWLSLKSDSTEDWERGSLALIKLGLWSPVPLKGLKELQARQQRETNSARARVLQKLAGHFQTFQAFHAVVKHDPRTSAAIPGLLERLDQKDRRAYQALESLAKRDTKVVEALWAHVGQKTDGWAYNLLCELTGLKPGTPLPLGDKGGEAAKPPSAGDLSHVKVGQVYVYEIEAGGTKLQMNFVVEKVDATSVRYSTETVVAGNTTKSPSTIWRAVDPKDAAAKPPANAVKTRFEAFEFQGESWETMVVESNGSTTWIPLKGGAPTFPPIVKTEGASKVTLVKIEQP